jgi:uncharacterized protein YjeT (DUF2065 family)
LLVTLLGYAWTLKGLLYLTVPQIGERALGRVSLTRAWEFAVAGVVLLAIGGVIIYSLAARGLL